MQPSKLREIYADSSSGILFGVQNTKITFATQVPATIDGGESLDVFTLVMPTDSLSELCLDVLKGLVKHQSFIATVNTELAKSLDAFLSAASEGLSHAGLIENEAPAAPGKTKEKEKSKKRVTG